LASGFPKTEKEGGENLKMPQQDKPLPKEQQHPIVYGPIVGKTEKQRHELLGRLPAPNTWTKRISGDDPQHP